MTASLSSAGLHQRRTLRHYRQSASTTGTPRQRSRRERPSASPPETRRAPAGRRSRGRHSSSTASRSGNCCRTGSVLRRTARSSRRTTSAMCAGSLRWMKVPRPESFETMFGWPASRFMPSRHAAPALRRQILQHAGMLEDEGDVGIVGGEPRRVGHLRGEDLQVERPAMVGEQADILAEARGRSSGPALAAKRYISLSCQCSCMRMPRISGIVRLPLQRLGDVVREQVGIADDGMRPAMLVGDALHPGDLLDGARPWPSWSGHRRISRRPSRRCRPGIPRSDSRAGSARRGRRCAAPSAPAARAGRPAARCGDARRRSGSCRQASASLISGRRAWPRGAFARCRRGLRAAAPAPQGCCRRRARRDAAGCRPWPRVSRPVARIGGKRRRPDQPMAEPRQPADGVDHRRRVAALQPVGEDERDGAAHQRRMARHRQEFLQRRADARAAVEIEDDVGQPAERLVRHRGASAIAVTRDSRVPKQKRLDLGQAPGDADARSAGSLRMRLHRAGDVDQEQQAARLFRPRLRASAAASRRRCAAPRAPCGRRSIRGAARRRRRICGSATSAGGRACAGCRASASRSASLQRPKVLRLRRCSSADACLPAASPSSDLQQRLRRRAAARCAAPAPRPAIDDLAGEGRFAEHMPRTPRRRPGNPRGEPVSVTRPSRARSAMLRSGAMRAALRGRPRRGPDRSARPASRSAAGKPASSSAAHASALAAARSSDQLAPLCTASKSSWSLTSRPSERFSASGQAAPSRCSTSAARAQSIDLGDARPLDQRQPADRRDRLDQPLGGFGGDARRVRSMMARSRARSG